MQDNVIPNYVARPLALFVPPSVPARRDMEDQRRGGLFTMSVCLVQAHPRQLIVGRSPRSMSSATCSVLLVDNNPCVLWVTHRLCIFACDRPTVPLVLHLLRLDGWFPCGSKCQYIIFIISTIHKYMLAATRDSTPATPCPLLRSALVPRFCLRRPLLPVGARFQRCSPFFLSLLGVSTSSLPPHDVFPSSFSYRYRLPHSLCLTLSLTLSRLLSGGLYA